MAESKKEKTREEIRKENLAKNEEYVEVCLFKDNAKYSDDVYVSVNGENCIIQRGVPVKIKRKFALVIEQSMKEDMMTAAKIAEATQGN